MSDEKPYLGIQVEGLRRLRSTMRQAGFDMKQLTAVNRQAAEIVATAARANAPVGDSRNGNIKNTIRAGATLKAGIVRVGNKRLPYGNFIHWKNKTNDYTGNPWVSEAAQATEPVWADLYWEELQKVINRVTGDS